MEMAGEKMICIAFPSDTVDVCCSLEMQFHHIATRNLRIFFFCVSVLLAIGLHCANPRSSGLRQNLDDRKKCQPSPQPSPGGRGG
jgi:hypothetical protein